MRFALLIMLASACTSSPVRDESVVARAENVRFLVTADEHGWLQPFKDKERNSMRGGVQLLRARLIGEGLLDDNVALISTGDNWTGPFLSTTLQGAPMVEAMNALGYRASALGNHEFDFGVRTLQRREAEANFPILAANLVQEASAGRPPWAKDGVILELGGRKVGLVGLATKKTPETTDPRQVVGHRFEDYDVALRRAVPRLRSEGAEIVIAAIHDGLEVGRTLVPVLEELDVPFLALGHEHKAEQETIGGVLLCNPGAFLRTACVVDIELASNKSHAKIIDIAAPLSDAIPEDKALAAIIARAEEKLKAVGDEALCTSDDALVRGRGLGQIVVDSWRARFPEVDVALTNVGGLRQDLPAGTVRVRDVRSVMPFTNVLVIVEVPAGSLDDIINTNDVYVSGAAKKSGKWTAAGKGANEKIRAVTIDFVYRGGDGFRFREFDASPEETNVDWRAPVLDVFRAREDCRSQ